MLILKVNVTYSELLDFATNIVNEYSVEKEDDLVQINKYREMVDTREEDDPWMPFIEGWVMGLGSRYGINIEHYIRKEKLDKINKINEKG